MGKVTSSHSELFCKKCVLKNIAKFTGKHLCKNIFFIKKKTLTQVFSCEICKTFKNNSAFVRFGHWSFAAFACLCNFLFDIWQYTRGSHDTQQVMKDLFFFSLRCTCFGNIVIVIINTTITIMALINNSP